MLNLEFVLNQIFTELHIVLKYLPQAQVMASGLSVIICLRGAIRNNHLGLL